MTRPRRTSGTGAPLLGPHAEREERDVLVAQVVGGAVEAALVVLPVGDDEERARPSLGTLGGGVERLGRDGERGREVGPLDGDLPGVGGVEEQAEGAPVGRERALEERLAREHDEPDPVAPALLDDALDGQLGPIEPRRGHVVGPHRVRHVEGHDQVEALLPGLADGEARARPRQRDAEAQERADDEPRPHAPLADHAGERRPLGLGARPEKEPERLAPPSRRRVERGDHGRHGDRQQGEDEG